MRLTSFSDYTLRVLMYLAVHPDELVTIQQIAEAYDISANNLMKVVNHLVKQGDVAALRGKGGGIRLARPAQQIRIGQVLRSAEGDGAIVECFSPNNQCRISADCKLAGVLRHAFETLYATLDQTTLADLVVSPAPLLAQLHFYPAASAR
ncbi:RrF2 family transcriptional regulator [Chitinimonas sp. PSY-7]|uniref:Rrf2 family transcriptional regulator n=1 Tax=Chitinimonas sp. PSY-7 TaxID=3459088 RepID=UPI0040400FAB